VLILASLFSLLFVNCKKENNEENIKEDFSALTKAILTVNALDPLVNTKWSKRVQRPATI
jgi:hypothetical protein